MRNCTLRGLGFGFRVYCLGLVLAAKELELKSAYHGCLVASAAARDSNFVY